jgi:uncharacterized protein YjiS (DUF1127 family)
MNAPAVPFAPLASPAARPAAATAATVLVALAAAAVVALFGEPSLAAAAAIAPVVPTLPQRPGDRTMNALQKIRELIAGLHKALMERRRLARLSTLRDLDDRALADLGIARSEIASIEAESRQASAVTRQRILRGAGHA